MKRFICFLCVIALLISGVACGKNTGGGDRETEEIINICNHSFGEWERVLTSADGTVYEEKQTCVLCGESHNKTVDLLETVPEQWIWALDVIVKSKNCLDADILNISYATTEDRANRNGNAVPTEDALLGGTARTWYALGDIPELFKQTFILTLDPGYFERTDVIPDNSITERLLRGIYPAAEITKEQIRGIEAKYNKEELFELYLNTVRFSDRIYGIASASMSYFSLGVPELDAAKIALLASAASSGSYDPYTDPDSNKNHRQGILTGLKNKALITEEEFSSAMAQTFTFTQPAEPVLSWYGEVVIADAISLLMQKYSVDAAAAENMLYSNGLKIYTVMDSNVQTLLQDFYADPSNFMRIDNGVQPQSSMVICDPTTGDVLALVGSRGEKTSNTMPNYATVNKRSPGSSIKPVAVYGPCLEKGIIHYSTLVDDNYYNKIGDKPWPSNWPEGYRGLTPVYDGVRRSVNTIAVRLLMQYGATESWDFVYNKLGMHSVVYNETTSGGYNVNDRNASALALGGMLHGLTVRELVGAYQIFNNGGVFTGNRTILKIEDRCGNVIIDNEGTPSQVISAPNASIMTKMLQNVVDSGTADCITLDDRVECAGKTGTTSYDKDRWFMGYTPYYMGGVWFAYENSRSLKGFSEIKSPAVDVWDKFMTKLHEQEIFSKGITPVDFTLNEGVIVKDICSGSGKLANSSCGSRITKGYYTEDNMPTEYCNYH